MLATSSSAILLKNGKIIEKKPEADDNRSPKADYPRKGSCPGLKIHVTYSHQAKHITPGTRYWPSVVIFKTQIIGVVKQRIVRLEWSDNTNLKRFHATATRGSI